MDIVFSRGGAYTLMGAPPPAGVPPGPVVPGAVRLAPSPPKTRKTASATASPAPISPTIQYVALFIAIFLLYNFIVSHSCRHRLLRRGSMAIGPGYCPSMAGTPDFVPWPPWSAYCTRRCFVRRGYF